MADKIIYGLLTVLVLSACGSDKQTSENKTFTFDKQITGTKSLIGKWTISSTITRTNDSEGEGLCNVCPTITFDNNTALLTFPDNHTENYTWKTSTDTLTLLSNNSQTVSTLPQFFHLKYKMEYRQKKEFLELRLSPDKDYTFVLRR